MPLYPLIDILPNRLIWQGNQSVWVDDQQIIIGKLSPEQGPSSFGMNPSFESILFDNHV
jgi:hypothetical protein